MQLLAQPRTARLPPCPRMLGHAKPASINSQTTDESARGATSYWVALPPVPFGFVFLAAAPAPAAAVATAALALAKAAEHCVVTLAEALAEGRLRLAAGQLDELVELVHAIVLEALRDLLPVSLAGRDVLAVALVEDFKTG